MGRPHYHARRWTIWLCMLLLLATGLSARSTSAAARVTTAERVEAGKQLLVHGTGFEPNEIVTSWASSAGGAQYTTEQGRADRNGDVDIYITIKRFWEVTWWAVTLRGSQSEREGWASFAVTATRPDGEVVRQPENGTVGTRIGFRGDGFRDTDTVKAWLTRPDGKGVEIPLELHPNDAGSVYFGYDIPRDAPTGRWYVTAYGTHSERLLVSSFAVGR